MAVALLPLGSFVFEVLRARLDRSRHRHALDIVGRRSAALRATVVNHERLTAYCLPGHRSRVVISEGALCLLAAVLEHERAHIGGRHHLAMALSEAFALAFRWLPLARHAREQTSVLLEMIADDRALRSHPRDVLATALYEMAASTAPRGAFSAGGPVALLRLQRVLVPGRRAPTPGALRGDGRDDLGRSAAASADRLHSRHQLTESRASRPRFQEAGCPGCGSEDLPDPDGSGMDPCAP